MKNLRCREDEAAYQAFIAGTMKDEGMHVLMRRIIDAVDAVRDREEKFRDRHEGATAD